MREIHIKLLRFEIKLDISQIALPLALVTVPRVCLRSCLLCCLCWRGDHLLLASRRGGHEASVLSSQSQGALSLERGGSTAGLSEFGDSHSLFLSLATQQDFRSSATPADLRISATTVDFRSSATPADFRSLATPYLSR